jgi:hypothetical protein
MCHLHRTDFSKAGLFSEQAGVQRMGRKCWRGRGGGEQNLIYSLVKHPILISSEYTDTDFKKN